MNDKIDLLIAEKQKMIEACNNLILHDEKYGYLLNGQLRQSITLFETFISDLEKLKTTTTPTIRPDKRD